MVPDLTDEIDGGNFFDQIDDLIDFSPDLKCDIVDSFMASYDAKGISTLWADPFSKADPLFSGDIASDLSAELSIPYEDIVQLEWLSTFVEESYSPCGEKTEALKNHFHTSSPLSVLETSTSSSSSSNTSSSSSGKPASFSTNPPHGAQRARSKRPRPATFVVWPTIHLVDSAPAKKKTNKTGFGDSGSVRKCTHCEITTTPQWRVGPMGPKTLCNACGVRHKSGRLFPEYRPAASPTFVASLHSNSHKKVLEMRCKGDNASKPPLVANP